jgi:hypothetical protein
MENTTTTTATTTATRGPGGIELGADGLPMAGTGTGRFPRTTTDTAATITATLRRAFEALAEGREQAADELLNAAYDIDLHRAEAIRLELARAYGW